MSVNGIELAVGQVWETRSGERVFLLSPLGANGCFVGCSETHTWNIPPTGRYAGLSDHPFDLLALLTTAPAKAQGVSRASTNVLRECTALEAERTAIRAQTPFPTIPPDAEPPAPTAPEILDAAAGHMRDRAATYDKPEGERSIAQVVAAFNAIHGTSMTEAQGWHFMSILKQVRAFAAVGKPHRDSLEDNVSYSALLGEAMLRGVKS